MHPACCLVLHSTRSLVFTFRTQSPKGSCLSVRVAFISMIFPAIGNWPYFTNEAHSDHTETGGVTMPAHAATVKQGQASFITLTGHRGGFVLTADS